MQPVWAQNKGPRPPPPLPAIGRGHRLRRARGGSAVVATRGWRPAADTAIARPAEKWLSFLPGRWGAARARAVQSTVVWKGKKYLCLSWWLKTEEAGVSETAFLQWMSEFSRSPINNMETNVNLWSHKAPPVPPGRVFKASGCKAATFWPTA